MNNLYRLLLIPFGLIYRLFLLSLDGSRDITNKLRFSRSIIDVGCCIDSKSKVGPQCRVMHDAFISNSTISQYSYIGFKSILQNVTVGSFCSISNQVYIGLGNHPSNFFSTSPLFYRRNNPLKIKLIEKDIEFDEYHKIIIGNDVWIGARVIVLDGVVIGNGAILAANSVVTKNVPPYAIVAGVPAKIIKYRFSEEKINDLSKSEWWKKELKEIDINQ